MKSLQTKVVLTKTLLMLLAGIMLLSFGGCALLPEEEGELPVPLVEVKQAEYVTHAPRRETLEICVDGKAEVVATQSADAAFADTAGYIGKLFHANGDYVEAGELLCVLDDPSLGEQLYEAELRAEISELQFAQAEKQYQNGELDEISWKQAELNIYIVRRELEKLRTRFEGTQLYAPISGVITYRASVSEGDYVNARDVLYTISDISSYYIRFSEIDYLKLPLYAECRLTLNYGAEPFVFTGKVIQTPDTISAGGLQIDKYSVLIKPDIELPADVTLGTRVDLYYQIDCSENTILIARHAIKTNGERRFVYVLEDGYRRERDVVVGLVGEYDAEILRGLDENDLVIY